MVMGFARGEGMRCSIHNFTLNSWGLLAGDPRVTICYCYLSAIVRKGFESSKRLLFTKDSRGVGEKGRNTNTRIHSG